MKSAFALLLALLLCAAFGCGSSESADSTASVSSTTDARSATGTPSTEAAPARAEPRRRGRPLPAFTGYTLDDQRLAIADLLGRRILIFFFNPEVRDSATAASAINSIARLRGKHNFEIVGIATGSDRARATAFVQEQGIEFPVIDDSNAALARSFGLRDPLALLGVDAEGYVSFGMTGFGGADARGLEANLRKSLRLPEPAAPASSHPQAPDFTASVLDGDTPFELSAHRGKPLVLVFFLHTCPHCHAALHFLEEALADLPEEKRPELVGLEITGRTFAVREMLKTEKLDFFPVLFDDDGSIQEAYGVFAGVPDIFLIDGEGRIVSRTQGWSPEKDEPLLRMRLARLAGAPVPMLLRTNGYSGSEVCGACHELEYETWTFTSHASAFDTLVKHGVENDPECVGCHVVGYGKPGGFVSATETSGLEDVGCESCHGRGGPHLSPDFVKQDDYAPVCVTCHDTKHSLGFDYATFRPRISHTENASLLTLSPEEKQKLLAERGRPGGSLLPTDSRYVGSDACRGCHAAEYQVWSASGHARAGATLEAKGRAGDAACLACHTTAMGKPGGFPQGASPAEHPDLARVGCESCHGPGGAHVAEGAPKLGTIVSLGDKCDSCVILQICGGCHDDANDPGFEFQVQEKIDRQRHGTLEPGTGKPKDSTASRRATDAELLARAFARADAERDAAP